ncbi:MAG: pyrimidine reductase family protein [Actinobacteria bacterium]|nr:pyrimidine reductase family protein [Actinomycetota bacterium]
MHRILPAPTIEIDTDDAYRAERLVKDGRPWIMLNMISSADGGIEVDGVSGPLGSAGDKDVFGTLRTIPDIILVGSGTAIAEDYGPTSTSVSTRTRRLTNGAWPVARLAVVSNSLSFDLDSRLFSGNADQRPIVITSEGADGDRLDRVSDVADLVVTSGSRVDLSEAMAQLAGIGARVVLCEGGPGLNGQMFEHNLVDEVCLSVAPLLVGGSARRIATGAAPIEIPTDLELRHVLTEDHYLFLRYVVSPMV